MGLYTIYMYFYHVQLPGQIVPSFSKPHIDRSSGLGLPSLVESPVIVEPLLAKSFSLLLCRAEAVEVEKERPHLPTKRRGDPVKEHHLG